MHTVVKCQPIESIDHAVVTMTSLTFQSQATINCSQGFLFEKVVKSLLATCGADGVWNVTAADVISNSTWVTLQSWHIQNLTCTRKSLITLLTCWEFCYVKHHYFIILFWRKEISFFGGVLQFLFAGKSV